MLVFFADIKYNVANILSLWDVNSVEEALSRIGWDKKRIDDEAETVSMILLLIFLHINFVNDVKQ